MDDPRSSEPRPGPDRTAPGWSPATWAVCAGRPDVTPGAPVNPPLTLTSTYVQGEVGGSTPVYGRYDNATWQACEQVLGRLEGAPEGGVLFGSGMAAIAAVLAQVPVGGLVLLPTSAYGTMLDLADALALQGRLRTRRVQVTDTAAVAHALRTEPVAALWLESPTNPLLEIADIPACAALAHAGEAIMVVDNTFATPLVQRPLDLGADVVVHSVTKYLAGHSDVVLGAALARDPRRVRALRGYRTLHGAVPGPAEAWLALRGLRTLDVRVQRAQASAAVLASRLAGHPAVRRVRHPSLPSDPGHQRARQQMRGFGAVVSVELADAEAAEAVASAVRLWVPATSLGGVESTLERRRRHPNEPTSVPESLLRLSVGIEDVEDLWADLDAALTRSA